MALSRALWATLLATTLRFLPIAAFTLVPTPAMTNHRRLPGGNPLISRRTMTPKNIHGTAILYSKSTNNKDEKDDQPSSAWLGTLVLPLWLVYISNQWSRSSIYYLVNFSGDGDAFTAMNVDLNFSQSQYGLLASVAFTSLFAVASLGAGVASDRYNRKVLTIVSAAAWSTATLGTALSSSYEEVVIWRIAMGLACAFSTPTAYTLLQEKVPKERGAVASSIYGTGVALGGALASLSLLLDSSLGWKNALLVIAGFGFGTVGLNTLFLPDDPKATETKFEEATDTKAQDSSITDEVLEVVSTSRVKWLFLGSFLRFSAGLSIGIWSAAYFRGAFPDNVSDYAVAQAGITSVGGVTSGVLGGIIADWLSSSAVDAEDPTGRKLWVPVVGSVLAVPAFYYSIHGGSFELAMLCLAIEYLVAECWFGPTISVLQSTVGPKIGGTAQGLFTLTGAIGNLAPSVLGFVYGRAAGIDPSRELADILAVTVCSLYLASAACFTVSSLSVPPPKTTNSEQQRSVSGATGKSKRQ